MPAPAKSTPATPPKRGWFRRALRWIGLLALVVALFHRPLFHAGVRLLLVQVAARQNIKLAVDFSGSIFTNLTVANVLATPTGTEPSPVRRIAIERVRLEYSLPNLLKHGVGEFLQRYEILDAHIEIDALPSKTKKAKEQNKSIAEDLNNILGQPAAYADRVRIENFNITVRAPGNVTEVTGFDLLLDPEKVGHLRIAGLQIPGVPVWENLAAETTYANRNFFIKGLQLAPELVLEEVNFDASQRAQNKGSTYLRARLFGGTFYLALTGSELAKKGENLEKSYDTALKIEAAGISLEDAAAYFGAPKPPLAKLARLDVNFRGEPEKPRTWDGGASASVEALTFGTAKVDGVSLAATFAHGKAELTGLNVVAGKNSVVLTATVVLPASVNDFPTSDVDGALKIDAPDLAALTAMLPAPITGRVSGGGPINLGGGWVKTDLALDAQTIAGRGFAVEAAKLAVRAEKRIAPAGGGPFEDLTSRITAGVTGLRAGDFAIDAVRLDAENRNDLVTLHTLEVRRAENSVSARGTYRVPADLSQAARAPVDAQFTVAVPKLAAFGIKVKDATLAGRVAGEGTLKLVNQALQGSVQIGGGDFQLGDYRADKLAIKARIAENVARFEQLTLQFNATDQLAITGAADVRAPFPYAGTLLLDVKDLAAFQPLLDVFAVSAAPPAPPSKIGPLAGALHLDWAGKGELAAVQPPLAATLGHDGKLNFALTKGRFDKIDLTEIKLAGLYGPGFAQSTELKLVTGQTSFGSVLEIAEGKARLKDISLAQGDLTVLSGFLILPIDLENLQQPIPLTGRIAANINANNLDLDKLLESFDQKSPVSGAIDAHLVASGTLLRPLGHFKLNARKLQSKAKAAQEFAPADLDLDLHYANKELTLNAVAKQPQIQPLTVKGRIPLDLEATVQDKKLDPALPLDVTVQLPASSLAVISKFAPQVRKIDGTLAIDVRAAGTVGKPVLSGTAVLDLQGARFDNANVPALGAFKARIAFADDTVTFNTFEGELGGGTFKLGGTVKLPTLTEPVFDLRLQSDEVLVKRDDAITVRADADVKLAGPLAAAAVSGTVFVTHSRFFKEIDILPIALPGKAKPAPKSARVISAGVSFPAPPLRDWKFDLAIKTRPGDSFLIRGNLANGAAAIDLKLAGTGLAPYLEGSIRVEEFKASLPFSTLSVTRGFIYFNKDAPFQPSLELQADSQARDYLVHAYVYGKATDPEIQLSSEPPLPYADIVSLLATGTTAAELTGSADALASKAAMIAIQQLYRKVFLRGKGPAIDPKKTSNGDFRDRFEFELGALDNRTGGQAITSRVRLTDQLYLIGDLGTEGGFTGRLKYLIRFR